MKVNRQWRLAARPVGLVKESDFEWREEPVPTPGEGELLVHNLYLSLDPTNRGWMNETATYLPSIAIGSVMRGITLGVVEQSRHARFPEGTLVQGTLGWQDYSLSNGAGLTVLPGDPSIPLTAHLGLFGIIGPTALACSTSASLSRARRSSCRPPPERWGRWWARSARSKAAAW